jgi:hypothetical protein
MEAPRFLINGMPGSVPGEPNLEIAAIPINRAFARAVSLMKRVPGASENCSRFNSANARLKFR